MFDFAAEETKTLDNLLSLLVAGPSGAGKSHLLGTHPGKTLYLTCGAEIHGASSAKKNGNNVVAIRIDKEGLTPDQSLERLHATLDPAAILAAEFKFIALDGLTELEKLIRQTTIWKKYCETKNGSHDNFKEPPATLAILDRVLSRLRDLQFNYDIDVAVTCMLDVTEKNARTGEIEAARPKLQSYGIVESAIQQFGDIIIIGRMTKADGMSGHVIQMNTDLSRVSMDEKTKEVKKIFGISPRLQGVQTTPPLIRADLKELLKLKGR